MARIMEEKKKKSKLMITGIVVLAPILAWCLYIVVFQKEGPYGWGPFTGVVLDAETKKPIKGAQISFNGLYDAPWMFPAHTNDVLSKYSETDSNGRYKLGKYINGGFLRNSYGYTIFIYKLGYLPYEIDVYFRIKREVSVDQFKNPVTAKFQLKNNVILLEKMDTNAFTPRDHQDLINYLGLSLGCGSDPKGIKFCEEAREEMILACMYGNIENPTPKNLCENYVNDKINGH
jgi:hypothetical protein